MKQNTYWFGKKLFQPIFGFFIPISWEGWMITAFFGCYLASIFLFDEFYVDYPLVFVLSIPVMVIPYYFIGLRKQRPKDKGKRLF